MASEEGRTAAFIDLDGTLCDIYLWQALFSHHRKNHFKRLSMYGFIALHMPIWLLHKERLLSRGFFYRPHATNPAWLVSGVGIERAETIWDWVIENEITPHLRPEMLEVTHGHQGRGHRVILIPGSLTPVLDRLAVCLGIEGAIATPLAVRSGRYTGRIVPPLNVGDGKIARLAQFLDGPGREIDLAESYCYTDSIIDLPMLEMFGHPVAVYPDEALSDLADERGWPIVDEAHHNR